MATTTPDQGDTVEQGLERAVEASRELAADAIRLARLEVVEAVRRAVGGAVLVGVSALLFTFAWIAGVVALSLFLARMTDPVVGVASVALAQLALAFACVLVARRRAVAAVDRP